MKRCGTFLRWLKAFNTFLPQESFVAKLWVKLESTFSQCYNTSPQFTGVFVDFPSTLFRDTFWNGFSLPQISFSKWSIPLLAYAFELKAPLMNKTSCKQRQVSIENCIALNMFFHSGKIHYSRCKKRKSSYDTREGVKLNLITLL